MPQFIIKYATGDYEDYATRLHLVEASSFVDLEKAIKIAVYDWRERYNIQKSVTENWSTAYNDWLSFKENTEQFNPLVENQKTDRLPAT